MSDNPTEPTGPKKSLGHLSPEVVGKLNPKELYEQKRFLELAHHPVYLRAVPATHIRGLMGWVEKNKGNLSPEEYESAMRSLQAALRAHESVEQTAPGRHTDSTEDQFAIIDRLLQAYSPFVEMGEDEEVAEEVNEGILEDAIQRCRAGIMADPDNAGFYRRRAEAYLLQERFDKALADYTKAIELEPSNVEYYLARAQFHGHQGPDEALRDYTKAIELDPSCWEAYEGRGSVLLGVDREGGLPAIDRAERALPDLLKAIELLGKAGTRSARHLLPPPSTPAAQLSRAASDIYDIALAYFKRATIHLLGGEYTRAVGDANQALSVAAQAKLPDTTMESFRTKAIGLWQQASQTVQQRITEATRAKEAEEQKADEARHMMKDVVELAEQAREVAAEARQQREAEVQMLEEARRLRAAEEWKAAQARQAAAAEYQKVNEARLALERHMAAQRHRRPDPIQIGMMAALEDIALLQADIVGRGW